MINIRGKMINLIPCSYLKEYLIIIIDILILTDWMNTKFTWINTSEVITSAIIIA